MDLNRAQLVVHNDEDLNKFRNDHRIPKDVQIECSKLNEIANFIEGCIWLI